MAASEATDAGGSSARDGQVLSSPSLGRFPALSTISSSLVRTVLSQTRSSLSSASLSAGPRPERVWSPGQESVVSLSLRSLPCSARALFLTPLRALESLSTPQTRLPHSLPWSLPPFAASPFGVRTMTYFTCFSQSLPYSRLSDLPSSSSFLPLPSILPVAYCDYGSAPPALTFDSSSPENPSCSSSGAPLPLPPKSSRHEWRHVRSSEWGERMEADLKPVLQPLYPLPLATTALRCTLLAFLPVLEHYLPQENLEDETETEGREPPPPLPPPDLMYPARSAVFGTLRDLATQILRRIVERLVAGWVEPHVGWALTKDTYKSARRKAQEVGSFSGRMRIVGDVFQETLVGHLLGSFAHLILQWKLDFADFLRYFYSHRRAIKRKPKLLAKQFERLQRRLMAHCIRAVASLVTGSAGAALGTIAWPGIGYSVGFALGDTFGAAGVNKWADPVIIRLQRDMDMLIKESVEEEAEEASEAERQRREGEPTGEERDDGEER